MFTTVWPSPKAALISLRSSALAGLAFLRYSARLLETSFSRATMVARENEVSRSLAEYRRNARPASAEERNEMRAAFGEGQTVVNILTGERYSL